MLLFFYFITIFFRSITYNILYYHLTNYLFNHIASNISLHPPPHITAASEDIISQILDNTERATIDIDDSPDGTTTIEVGDINNGVDNQSSGSRKPPFPGDFIDNRNGQACVTKIQREMFTNSDEDVLSSTATRNAWFERKVQCEWFKNFELFQE